MTITTANRLAMTHLVYLLTMPIADDDRVRHVICGLSRWWEWSSEFSLQLVTRSFLIIFIGLAVSKPRLKLLALFMFQLRQ